MLLCPTSPVLAYRHDTGALEINGRKAGHFHASTATATFGISGSPAISVPVSMSREGLPIGVQLIANHNEEPLLLHLASILENVLAPGSFPPI